MTVIMVCRSPIRFMIYTFALWIDHHLNISNHMTKSIYVAIIRIIMMPSCPYFIFIDASTSKHEDIFIVIGFSLEDKWGLSLGELIRPFCIMLLWQYLLHYGLLFHVISQHLWLFSLILQGIHEEGECRQLEFWLEKEQILKAYSAQLQKSWNSTEYLKINKEKLSPKMKARGPTPCSRGWGARPLPRGPPGGSPTSIFYMKSFDEKK